MNMRMIDQFLELNDISYINSLTLTGGEPFLNPSGILKLANILKSRGTRIGMFYMATNGAVSPIPAMEGLGIIFELIDDTEYFQIEISQDEYHQWERDEIHPAWNLVKHGDKEGLHKLINQGRALDYTSDLRESFETEWIWDEENPDRMEEGMVYINVNGTIVKDCDLSYKSQKLNNYGHCLTRKLTEII
jgi:organic radical activating enzyme